MSHIPQKMLSALSGAGGNMGAMTDHDDMTLLQAWARDRSEAAFRTVVERYAGLVFGVALRRTGDRPMAEEAVQNVFTDLAKKAAVLVELQRPLAAWLHRCAVYESATLVRSEIRHREKMKRFSYTPSDEPAPDPWREVLPLLDDAINSLSAPDRSVLMQHWFERRTFAEIAEKSGGNAGSLQRRGLRALDKLAAVLRRRGVIVPVTVLAAGLTSQLAHAAPAGMAASVSAAAAHAAPATGGFSLFIQYSLHAMASAKLTTVAVVLISAAIPVSVQLAATPPSSRPGSAKGIAAAVSPSSSSPLPAKNGGSAAAAGTIDLAALRRALEQARNNDNSSVGLRQLARLMLTLTKDEIPAVTELLRELARGENGLDLVVEACYTRWAEFDPDAASTAALALPPGSCKWAATHAAFETWMAGDRSKAWTWLQANVSGDEWWAAAGGAVRRLAASDPQGVLALLADTKDPDVKRGMPSFIAEAWAPKDPEAALAWALTMPGSQGTKLAGKVLEYAGTADPARAMGLLNKIDNASAQGEAGWNVVWPWALRAPDKAFEEMMQNGASWPDRIAYGIGDAMARHDAGKAAEAAHKMPPGPRRDEFVQGILIGVPYTDPGAAVSVMELISDKELMSHGGLNTFVEAWARKDAVAAAQWIASLPDDSSHKKEFAASHFQSQAGRSYQEVLQKGGAK
jgi:RNA polymerase sigma factor (sigma-70 family)